MSDKLKEKDTQPSRKGKVKMVLAIVVCCILIVLILWAVGVIKFEGLLVVPDEYPRSYKEPESGGSASGSEKISGL